MLTAWTTLLIGILMVAADVTAQTDKREPPKISSPNSQDKVYVRKSQSHEIKCTAEGQPQAEYKWQKDKQDIQQTGSVSYNAKTGMLNIEKMGADTEGEYWCIASNRFTHDGKTITAADISPGIKVLMASLGNALSGDEQTHTMDEYQSLKLNCDGFEESDGPVKYYWFISKSAPTPDEQIQPDDRVYIDTEGSLFFSYLEEKDATEENQPYKCGIGDSMQTIFSENTHKLIVRAKAPSQIKPTIMPGKSNVEAYVGTDATLECVFAGYDPTTQRPPKTTWRSNDGPITGGAKYDVSQTNRLVVKNVKEADEANYYCSGKLSSGVESEHTIKLNVVARPIWETNGRPQDQTVVEGHNAIFHCNTRSAHNEPAPRTPVWYINARKEGPHLDPKKFVFSPDRKTLTVRDTSKATDILCVYCIVENQAGVTAGSGCLNVILPITIETQPKPVQTIKKGDIVDLTVTASTDKLFSPLSYKWVFDGKEYSGNSVPPHVDYNSQTLLATIKTDRLTQKEFESIAGVYKRVVYNAIESKEVQVEVVLAGTSKPAAGGFDMWIIGLIIGILIFIILLIIIIVIICRKQQEADYNVDKKENNAGYDPEKELKESGFHDLSTPEYDKIDIPDEKPPENPEDDSILFGGDDESLQQYGKDDTGRFTNDGTFRSPARTADMRPPSVTEI